MLVARHVTNELKTRTECHARTTKNTGAEQRKKRKTKSGNTRKTWARKSSSDTQKGAVISTVSSLFSLP